MQSPYESQPSSFNQKQYLIDHAQKQYKERRANNRQAFVPNFKKIELLVNDRALEQPEKL